VLTAQFIREHADIVRQAMANRHADTPLDRILELDARRREILQELESLRAERKQRSARIGAAAPDERQQLIDDTRAMSTRISELEPVARDIDTELDDLLLQMPNIPDESVPVGIDAEENVEVREWGERPSFEFQPRPHWELAEALGIVDFERGAKLAGARFEALVGHGAALSRALATCMLDMHIWEHGYTEIAPPYLVKPEVMLGTGQLPKFGEDAYFLERDDLYLIPTSEVPVANFHREEILEGDRRRFATRRIAPVSAARREPRAGTRAG
jgi:seryl-tRNA synthetase